MNQHLGFDCAKRTSRDGKKNYLNDTVKRIMKSQLGEVDVIHYKIGEHHQVVTKAAYFVLGIYNGKMKEVLGL